MNKRPFQILDEMNVYDTKNNTNTLEVSATFIAANKCNGGAKIEMGVPESCLLDMMNNKKKAILLLVDMDKYNEIKKEETNE